MSDYNSILTDKEMRELLNKYIMEQPDDNVITNKLIEMESKLAFNLQPTAPLIIPNEMAMVNKLTKTFGSKSSFTAWFAGIAIVTVGTVSSVLYYNANTHETRPTAPTHENITPVENNTLPQQLPEPNKQFLPPAFTSPNISKTDSIAKKDETFQIFQEPLVQEELLKEVENFTAPTKPEPKENNSPLKTTVDTSFANVKKLVVHGGICDISVKGNSGQQTTLKGNIKITKKGIVIKTPEYTIEHKLDGNTLTVTIKPLSEKSSCLVVGSLQIDAALNFEVPFGTEINLDNNNGDILVENIVSENGKVSSSFGDVNLVRINGDFMVAAQSGDVSMSQIHGDVKLKSTYGDIKIFDVTGNLSIESSSGDIALDKLNGKKCSVKATYGDIALVNITAQLDVFSSSGSISLTNAVGNVQLKSTYGNVKLEHVNGNIAISSSSGDVHVKEINGDIDIRANYGDVHTNSCAGNIAVVSSSGSVKGKNVTVASSMDITTTYGDIKMQLNNGLEDLTFNLQANAGDVIVKKNGQTFKGDEGKLNLSNGKIKINAVSVSGDQVFE